MNQLTDEEIKCVAIGYIWNPDMTFLEFYRLNGYKLTYESATEVWDIIQERYIEQFSNKN